MKNKKFTPLLLICVAVLWGIIFYRVFLAMDEKVEKITHFNSKKMEYFKAVNHIEDKVELDLAYRNPFSTINTIAYEDEAAPEPKKVMPLAPPSPKPPTSWPNIQYTGYIKNTNSKQNLAILLANGKEFMLTEGQTLNEIKLIKYAIDSIKIQYQNSVKYIKLR